MDTGAYFKLSSTMEHWPVQSNISQGSFQRRWRVRAPLDIIESGLGLPPLANIYVALPLAPKRISSDA